MPQLSPEEKTELCIEVLRPFIDQYMEAWDTLKAEGVDYDTFLNAVFLQWVTGVKNLSHHSGHTTMFLQMLPIYIPGIYLMTMDRGEPESEAEGE